MRAKLLSIGVAILMITTLTGCTKVQPWQKGKLAKPHMQFDPDQLESRFNRHIEQSKEAASGGYGISGGGCGCN